MARSLARIRACSTRCERFVLVDDLWAAVLAGVATASEFLEIAQRFADERDLVVWRILGSHLRAAGRLVAGDALDAYKAKVAALVEPALGRLGWDARPATTLGCVSCAPR